MSEDRWAALEQRLAALEREVAVLRNALNASGCAPYVSPNPNDPLEGHPLLWRGMSDPKELAEHEARINKQLRIEHLEPIEPAKLRQMMIELDGLDPNGTEFSRGIIEMREE
jgi:hypothetical protein